MNDESCLEDTPQIPWWQDAVPWCAACGVLALAIGFALGRLACGTAPQASAFVPHTNEGPTSMQITLPSAEAPERMPMARDWKFGVGPGTMVDQSPKKSDRLPGAFQETMNQ